MTLRLPRTSLLGCLAVLSFGLAAPLAQAVETAGTAPDRIYVNARVWTGESSQPAAEAFAVRGDRIVAVGTTAEVRAHAGPATEIVDLDGRRVVPGFNDAHWHLPARKDARLDNAGRSQ